MKWKTFFQIMLLMIFGAILFYIVFPKYHSDGVWRHNKITGKSNVHIPE